MFLKWNKHMISNVFIAGTEITKGRDKIIISITHSEDRDKENEYPGLITMRRDDRHNELFTHHFVAYGWTDEEIFTDAEEHVMKILDRESKKYQDASDMITQAMINFKGVDNNEQNG